MAHIGCFCCTAPWQQEKSLNTAPCSVNDDAQPASKATQIQLKRCTGCVAYVAHLCRCRICLAEDPETAREAAEGSARQLGQGPETGIRSPIHDEKGAQPAEEGSRAVAGDGPPADHRGWRAVHDPEQLGPGARVRCSALGAVQQGLAT